MEELSKNDGVRFVEFFMPEALPGFCTGCTLCANGLLEKCPNAQYVTPILDALIGADALVFATPHYGACSMPASMKSLFDHLDFLVLPVAPRGEMFDKKAFILTTGAGSAAAVKPIKRVLKHWGVNRVQSLGFRMFTNKWDKMPKSKQVRYEKNLRRAAIKFYKTQKGRPYVSTILFYHMAKFIVKKQVGPGNYPYEHWQAKGYFHQRPL